MNKPTKRTITYYDYSECVDYINDTHGVDIDDFTGRYTGEYNPDAPVQSFWHYVSEGDSYEGIFYMYKKWEDDAEDWQKQIIGWFFEEFSDGEDCIEFWVEW